MRPSRTRAAWTQAATLALLLAPLGAGAQSEPPAASAAPADARPTREEITQLLQAMGTRHLIDTYLEQLDAAMRASVTESLRGTALNAEQRQILTDMSAEMTGMVRAQLDWNDLQPMLQETYRDTFTRQEVADMLQFYRSPTGQAVVAKLPGAMQRNMQAMQERMRSIVPKLQQLQRETDAALQRAAERPVASPVAH